MGQGSVNMGRAIFTMAVVVALCVLVILAIRGSALAFLFAAIIAIGYVLSLIMPAVERRRAEVRRQAAAFRQQQAAQRRPQQQPARRKAKPKRR